MFIITKTNTITNYDKPMYKVLPWRDVCVKPSLTAVSVNNKSADPHFVKGNDECKLHYLLTCVCLYCSF